MRVVVPKVLFLCSGNYYRSRFAELFFNHLVAHEGIGYRADSAGLWPNCRAHNHGPIAAQTVAALETLGVALPELHRIPRDVSENDFREAVLTVCLKEAEHRPIVAERFPRFLDHVEFWHVDDVEDAPPSAAIPMMEANVRALVARLSSRKS